MPGDVSVAELPEMKSALDEAAVSAGDVASARPPAFWVTEFSWDSDPPDPGGVPGGARRALGGPGALRHVELRRQPRDLVHAP